MEASSGRPASIQPRTFVNKGMTVREGPPGVQPFVNSTQSDRNIVNTVNKVNLTNFRFVNLFQTVQLILIVVFIFQLILITFLGMVVVTCVVMTVS